MADWISTKDRLPEIGEKVLLRITYKDYEQITIGLLTRNRNYDWSLNAYTYFKFILYNIENCSRSVEHWVHASDGCPGNEYVTHWMPLPELPKDIGENSNG